MKYTALLLSCATVFNMCNNAEATEPRHNSQGQCVEIDVKSGSQSGKIVAEMDNTGGASKTVQNFLGYVDDGFYTGTIFHRVISGFMIQTGGFSADFYTGNTQEKSGGKGPIPNESSPDRPNLKGTLAMARTSDPDSATSQFFISLNDNPNLDGDNQNGYSVFGKVLSGMDQVEMIGSQATSNIGGMDDVPDSPVEITGVTKVTCP
jgi:peptidyl-prolyl cis-trans isomerase A (cyclophilin A)